MTDMPLLGRSHERQALRDLIERGSALLGGEAGIGKTTLAMEVVAATGRRAFVGGGLATLAYQAYLALERATGSYFNGGDAAWVAENVTPIVGDGILVVDDAQWVHPWTIDALAILVDSVRVLVIVRTGEPGAEAVGQRLDELTRLDLGPLPTDAAKALLRRTLPDVSAAAAAVVLARAGNNPLLIEELAATGEPSESLRFSVVARLRPLDDAPRRVVEHLAFARRPLASKTFDTGIEDALRAQLVLFDGDEVVIRHGLIAEMVVEDTPPDRAAEIHRSLARTVDEAGEAARHHLACGELDEARARALVAAAQAIWPAERAAHLAVAAEATPGIEGDDQRIAAIDALVMTQQFADASRLLAEIVGDDAATRARTAYARSRIAFFSGDPPGSADALERGLADADEAAAHGSSLEAETVLRMRTQLVAWRLVYQPDPSLLDDLAELREAAVGMRSTEIATLQASAMGFAMVEDYEAGQAALAKAIELSDPDVVRVNLLANLASLYTMAARRDESGETRERAIALAGELQLRAVEREQRGQHAAYLSSSGRYREVADLLEIAPLLGNQLNRAYVENHATLALGHMGRFADARRVAGGILDNDERARATRNEVSAHLAWVELWAGRPTRALEIAQRYQADETTDGSSLNALAHVERWAQFDLGHDPGEPLKVDDLIAMEQPAATETEGIAQLAAGNAAKAAETFARAAKEWSVRNVGRELWCRYFSATAVAPADDTATSQIVELNALDQLAAERDMGPLRVRVRQSLRDRGQATTGVKGPRRANGAGLSKREQQVLRLIADGMTNSEIAATLGLSVRTVESHVSRVIAKLGASTRAHAAAVAADVLDQNA